MPHIMNSKLDPILAEIVEQPELQESRVRVLVALNTTLDESELAMLEASGLVTGSIVGDIATGSVKVADLPRLAAMPQVVAIEGGRPMEPEQPL
jgi:hypothetical protein